MNILTAFLEPFLPYIIGGAALIAGYFGITWKAKREGRRERDTEALEDRVKRNERGRDAVAKEQSETSGLSNSDIVDRMRSRK